MSRVLAFIAAAGTLMLPCTAVAQAPLPTTDAPGSMHGKVVAYTSGTAFALLDSEDKLRRVKLTGIDAPERRQRFATQARQLASEWLGRSAIHIRIDGIGKDGRAHGRVEIDGRDVGLTMITAGLAWCDPSDLPMLPAQARERYNEACSQAKNGRQGIWRDANPVPPWEYRKIPEFDPLPQPQRGPERSCRDIGYQSVQCDDGTRYRAVGDEIQGSDGSTYARRGRTLTGEDGSRYTQQGTSTYGTDGTICRTRGRQTTCY